MKKNSVRCERLIYESEVWAEAMPDFVSRLNLTNYFTLLRNHIDGVREPNGSYRIPSNALYIFPISLGLSVNVIHVLNYTYMDKPIDKVFHDFSVFPIEENDIPKEDVIEIKVNDVRAGYYYIEKNTLILSDWTHNASTLNCALSVMPKLMKDLGMKYVASDKNVKYKITLGADPEFEVLDKSNKVVNAAQYLRLEHRSCNTPIGLDGCERTGEFRPDPSETPEGIVENIAGLMNTFYKTYQSDLSVEGETNAIGFHVHVGICDEKGGEPFPLNVGNNLIKLFADFLGKPLRHLNGSARGDYNQIMAFRKNEHGFEYRALPAGVLCSPKLTYYVFKIAKNIVHTYINHQGTDLVYNSPVTSEDYMNICGMSVDEYRDFVHLSETAWRFDKYNIIGAWIGEDLKEKIEAEPAKVEPVIWFKDEWAESLINYIKPRLISFLRDNNITVPICLFGIKAERGMISSFPTLACKPVELSMFPIYQNDLINGRSIPLGLPSEIRRNSRMDVGTAEMMIEDMKNYIMDINTSSVIFGRA